MITPTRYTIAKRFGKTALNFLYHSRYLFISANLKLYTRCTNASLIFFCSVCILRSASTSIGKSCDTSPRSSDSAPVSSLPCWDVNSLHVQNLAHFSHGFRCWISAQTKEHTDKPHTVIQVISALEQVNKQH
jgi:hypothetical protein